MTDGDALHAAVLAHPDEDTPRLAYADWLDEHGDGDRAEFVRVQVELARTPPDQVAPWDQRVIALRAREKALLAARGERWLAPLKDRCGPLHGPAHGQFRRGFVEVVWMPAARFRAGAEALFARVPVRELRVTEADEAEFARLMQYPLVGRLAGLDLSDRVLGDRVADGLAWSPFTGGLRVVRVRACGVTDEGAFRLAGAEFGGPRELDVSHNPIGPAGLAALRDRFGAAVRAAGMLPPG